MWLFGTADELDSSQYNDLGCGLADPGFKSWQKPVIFLIWGPPSVLWSSLSSSSEDRNE